MNALALDLVCGISMGESVQNEKEQSKRVSGSVFFLAKHKNFTFTEWQILTLVHMND